MAREYLVDGFTNNAAAYDKVKHIYIWAGNTITVASMISLTIVLLTAYLSPSIRRTGTWFAFLGSWLITSISNILLVRHQIGPSPDRSLCLFQTMLVYSNPVLNAVAGVGFILEVYMALTYCTRPVIPRLYTLSLYIVPAVIYVGVLIEVLVLGVRNPQWVERDPTGMYCHLSKPISVSITSAIVITAMLLLLLLEVLVGVAYYQTWKITREFKDLHGASANFNVTIRFGIFNSGVFFALTFGFWSFVPKTVVNSARLDLALSSLPFLASIIFGTHKDFFRVWFPFLQRQEEDNLIFDVRHQEP
ncbi:hypothetical protein BJ165DRAFT_619967 [Panaeolus papilionaceus]|nr:hypothetical protein BJ165DRAFT_619967 [Panaeolus papilionaceus]